MRDLTDDPGLVPTRLCGPRGAYVGEPATRHPIRRFAEHARLERILQELYAGFGPQQWWPGETPFEVIVGAILTQNTAWKNVGLALANLRAAERLKPARLLELSAEELAPLVRPAGYFNAKARKLREISAWYLDVGGLRALRERPLEPLRDELLGVWGVGPETADSILCYAAGRTTVIVDTYTRRILSRHELLDAELDYEEIRAWLAARLVREQVVVEEFHALFVRAGYDNCKPSARCETCPVVEKGVREKGAVHA
jgi:endonuclease-3 related protein